MIEKDIFGHVIDGDTRRGDRRGDARRRRSGDAVSVIAKAAAGTADDVDRAARSARAAFEDGRWRNQPPMAKEKVLRNMAALVAERGDVFAEIDVLDAGLLRMYTGFIVQFAVDGLEYFSGWPSKLQGAIPAVPSEFNVYQTREPIGVVGLIMPWNGPTAVFAMVAAALAAGNSVVLKPAEQTPMAAVLMAEMAVEAGLPPGVFNVVQGTGKEVGQPLVEHPEVDAISFTGSVATGSAIQAAAAKRVKRVSLELGGKSPFIVFPDADLDVASATSMSAVWGASGQVCTCGTRVLVHDSLYDDFVNRVVDGTKGMKIGPGMDPTSEMGPGRVRRPARAGQEVRRHRPGGGRRVGARRASGRRHGLLPRAHGVHRRAQRHAHRPGGDLRPGDGHPALLRRGGGIPHRQRRELRAGGWSVDQRPQPGPAGHAGVEGGHGVGQHLPDGVPERPLRRRQAVGPRTHARRRVDRRD